MRSGNELVDRAMRLLLAKDMDGFADLWAVDGVMEFPFAPPGHPRPEGREAVREHLRDYPDQVDLKAITYLRVHQTADPDVVIVEFQVDGVAVKTGRPYPMRYISVITTRDGEIVCYRDYWNPLAVASALGGLAEMAAAFAGGQAR